MRNTKSIAYAAFSLLLASIAQTAFAGPVNINTASAEQLDKELNGVGPAIAQRIVEHRETQGRFTSASELVLVKGVGEKTISKNADFILVE